MTNAVGFNRFWACLGLLLIYLPVPILAGLAARPGWLALSPLGVPAALWGLGALIIAFVAASFLAASHSEANG